MPELLLTDEATSTELLSAAEEVGPGADVSYFERSPADGGEIEPTRAPSLWTRLSQGLLGHGASGATGTGSPRSGWPSEPRRAPATCLR